MADHSRKREERPRSRIQSQTPEPPPADAQRLIHELRVRQAGLEAQNRELRRSEQRLRTAVQAGQIGTYEADLDTGTVYWSPELRAIFGISDDTPAEYEPGTVPSFIHADDAAELGELIRRAYDLSGNGAVKHEHRIVRADGAVRWVLMKGRVSFEGEGDQRRAVRSSGVILDITERKEAEDAQHKSEQELALINLEMELRVIERSAALAESEERFRALFEEAPDGCFLMSLDGRFLDGNKTAEELIGCRREELIGVNLFESGLLPDSFHELAADQLARQAGGERIEPTELRLIHKDGTEVLVEITSTPIQVRGQPAILGSARDLTLRKQAEAERERLGHQRQLALDAAQMGWWHLDPQTGISTYDRRLREIFGIAGSECPVEDCFTHIDAEDRPGVRAAVEAAMDSQNPQPYGIEYRITRPDGSRRWIEARGLAAFEGTGDARRATGFSGTAADITERRQMQEALEKRVVALTRPLDEAGSVSFDDLFSLDEIQLIQDGFSNIAGVASVITDPAGMPITEPRQFTEFCNLIGKTEQGCVNCAQSAAVLGRHHPEGPVVQPCLSSGLWEAGAGIEVGGRHIANWLIGQVRDGTQTEEQMRAYAREIGADEEAVAKAFGRVPLMSRERFDEIAQALFTLANQLSTSAYQNVQQARFITAQKTAEAALSESEEKYRKVFESENDAIMIFDGGTRQFVDVNNAAKELYGYTREEFLKLSHGAISAEPDVAAKAIPAPLAGHPPPTFASRHRKKDGTVFPVEITGCTFMLAGRPVICWVIRDITRRTANEQEILRNREELRHLASELSLAGQRERQRIAAELHDSVSQLLATCCLRLDELQKQPRLPEAAALSMESVGEILRESLRQTQGLTFELSCPLLDELGLAAALDELCRSLSQEHAVRFQFEGEAQPLHLSLDSQLILYRAARELMMNVIKHSGAERAGTILTCKDGAVQISIEDDGRGFNASAAGTRFSPTGGFGLFNLSESIRHAGGTLEVQSAPGHGTQAMLTLPFEK